MVGSVLVTPLWYYGIVLLLLLPYLTIAALLLLQYGFHGGGNMGGKSEWEWSG